MLKGKKDTKQFESPKAATLINGFVIQNAQACPFLLF